MRFEIWLETQANRDDPVGHFAANYKLDKLNGIEYKLTLRYLKIMGASEDTISIYRQAYREYVNYLQWYKREKPKHDNVGLTIQKGKFTVVWN